MRLISEYVCIYIFLFDVKRVLGQECIQSQSSSCKLVGTTNVLSSQSNLYNDKSHFQGETGIDFLAELEANLDKHLYFGTTSISQSRRDEIPIWNLVQKFIRDIKGVPEISTEHNEIIGSGENPKRYHAWCFEPYKLKELVKVEIKIYGILKHFYLENERFPAFQSYLKDIEESTLKTGIIRANVSKKESHMDDTDKEHLMYIATHPLAVYRLIRRFALDLQPILFLLKSYKELPTVMFGYANPFSLVFPDMTDLKDALRAIARTQVGNILDTHELAKGKLENQKTNIQLNALQALEVGTYYLRMKIYDLALEWIYLALNTVRHSTLAETFPWIIVFFEYVYETAVLQHNTNWWERSKNEWFHPFYSSIVEPSAQLDTYTKMSEIYKTKALQNRHETEWNWSIHANFKRLCSGENLQSEIDKSTLKCWYERSRNPYWMINPLKMELLSDNPEVFQVYEFIGDNLITNMKEIALPQLKRSKVVNSSDVSGSKVDNSRTSSQTWINDEEPSANFLIPLSRKLELVSGLKIIPATSSHQYQVALYGTSHHYEVHLDAFVDSHRWVENGNRIATIMGYLNNVLAGGRTAFPILGFSVTPVKGSIVMWCSLKRNGKDIEKRSYHGGCPVMLGTKWVTNKWVLYNDNFRKFPCTLKSDE